MAPPIGKFGYKTPRKKKKKTLGVHMASSAKVQDTETPKIARKYLLLI